jgi:hypothetical protein
MNKKLALRILISDPFSILNDGISAQKEKYHRKRIKTKYNIEQLPTVDILDLFPGLNGTLDNYSFLNGTSLITDILLLKSFAQSFENCSYLEIGSWRGESISNVADVAKDCTSVSLSAEELRALNFGESFISNHGIFSRGKRNITSIGHDSRTYDFSDLNKKFDLIFIDGDHSYEGVLNDSIKTLPLRRNETSVIVWHDYGFNTEEVRHSVLNGILDGIPEEKHNSLFHVSNTMCAIYIEGRQYKTTYTRFPNLPDKKFSLQIRAEKFQAYLK